jgi:hypothetical protein
MELIFAWALSHPALIGFIISEVVGILPVKYNGIVHGLAKIVMAVANSGKPEPAPECVRPNGVTVISQ